jgi:hypothetical protein
MALDPPLLQRVAMKIRLSTLTEEATKAYVIHRLAVAGNREMIFTDEALRRIFRYSDGFPRKINVLCDNALFQGFLMRQKIIDDAIVQEMASDLGFESNTATRAGIPSMDIPAAWVPDGEKLEDIVPVDAVNLEKTKRAEDLPAGDMSNKGETSAVQAAGVNAHSSSGDDDLDVQLEEFFEDTFKES